MVRNEDIFMKVVILAGGKGTRISEESQLKPKPMIEIGGMPIIWHIMKTYSYYGFKEFIICGGYKQHMIKQWFSDYCLWNSDVTFEFGSQNNMIVHQDYTEDWKVTIVDTGLESLTGTRIAKVRPYIGDNTFMMTYGDGVCAVNIEELVKYHENNDAVVTLTAARIQQRFGVLSIDQNSMVTSFREKSESDAERVNAGYMVLNPEVFDYIGEGEVFFEQEPLRLLAENRKLAAYKYNGFWHPMDTMRDKEILEKLWESGQAPWKVWEGS